MFRILWLLSAHGTVLAWGSEHVQNIMTIVCTWYEVIKSTVCTHYKLFITTVCTWCKVINSTDGTQSHSPSVPSFTLQLVFFLPITIHFVTIFFQIQDPLDGSTFVIFDAFVTGSDCFWWLVTGEQNIYGYNTFCYCSGIC